MIEKTHNGPPTALRVAPAGAVPTDATSGPRRSTPLILPPATVDAALAADAARIKRDVAAARGEAIDDDTTPASASGGSTGARLRNARSSATPHGGAGGEPADREPHQSAAPQRNHASSIAPDAALAADRSVADVAASVIAAMRSVGSSHDRHLEAIELEAARRCELLTAQAELDAELIRLNARREAHAIVSAARARVGDHRSPEETGQLNAIGETFSRFAEAIETTIAPGPSSPY